ncbi:hypothetical protein E2C01_002480 [Portunus trituberculatus]|uniref:Uncharacterized protein n=1 Tax=Portunus trituberculatus TaxID=210409 RepID=A0A5B7CJH0_PORTR|nr:hypothetical protein [Portunus trituberculatus]
MDSCEPFSEVWPITSPHLNATKNQCVINNLDLHNSECCAASGHTSLPLQFCPPHHLVVLHVWKSIGSTKLPCHTGTAETRCTYLPLTLTTEPDSLGEEEWVFLCFMVSEISAINFSDSSSSSASEPSSSSIEMANRW